VGGVHGPVFRYQLAYVAPLCGTMKTATATDMCEVNSVAEDYARFAIDFFELLGQRADGDLRREAFFLQDGWTRLLNHAVAGGAPSSELLLLSRLVSGPLRAVSLSPNSRLKRARSLQPVVRVRQQDAACLRWLAKQPGRNILEKSGAKQKVMGVERRMHSNVLENRAVNLLAVRLTKRIEDERQDRPSSPYAEGSLRQLRDALHAWGSAAHSNGITSLTYMPSPNSVLRRDRRYRRLWLGLQRLASEGGRLEAAVSGLDSLLTHCAAQCVSRAFQELGWQRIESGWLVSDGDDQVLCLPRHHGSWVNADNRTIRHVDIYQSESGCIEVLFRGVSSSGFKMIPHEFHVVQESDRYYIKLIKTLPNGQDLVLVDKRVPIPPELDAVPSVVEAFAELLSTLTHLATPSTPGKSVSRSSEIEPCKHATIRFTFDHLEREIEGMSRTWPLYAGIICGGNHGRSSFRQATLNTVGDAARRLVSYRESQTQTTRTPCMSRHVPRSWVLPGIVLDRLDVPKSLAADVLCQFLLQTCEDIPRGVDMMAMAWPGSVGIAAYRHVHKQLSGRFASVWMVPQPVAVAIQWTYEGGKDALPGYYVFVDLEGEKADVEVLELRDAPDAPDHTEWLRWGQYNLFETPALAGMIHGILDLAVNRTRAASPSRRSRLAIVSQLDIDTLGELLRGKISEIVLWMDPVGPQTKRIVLKKEDVQGEVSAHLHECLRTISRYVGECMSSGMRRPLGIVINGTLAHNDSVEPQPEVQGIPVMLLGRDTVNAGLSRFLKLEEQGLPSWRDYVPKVELSVIREGKEEWINLFEDTSDPPRPGETVVGRSFQLKLQPKTPQTALPLKRDGHCAAYNPVITLEYPPRSACPVDVQATYRTALDGLVIQYHSHEAGLIPLAEVTWGKIQEVVNQLPEEWECPSRDLPPARLDEAVTAFRDEFESVFSSKQPHLSVLTKSLRRLGRLLSEYVKTSDCIPWMAVQGANPESLSEVTAMLLYIHGDRKQIVRSVVLPKSDKCRGFRVPHGATAKDTLKAIMKAREIRIETTRTLGLLRAACPTIVQSTWTRQIVELRSAVAETEDTLRVLRAAGRSAGSWQANDDTRKLINAMFQGLAQSHDLCSHGRSCRALMWAVGTFLRGHHDATLGMPQIMLLEGANRILEMLTHYVDHGPIDDGQWSDTLYALLSFRHCTRNVDGMDDFGPDSPFVQNVGEKLRSIRQALYEGGRLSELANIHASRLGIREKTPFKSSDILGQVTELWQGKVTALLVQEAIDAD